METKVVRYEPKGYVAAPEGAPIMAFGELFPCGGIGVIKQLRGNCNGMLRGN